MIFFLFLQNIRRRVYDALNVLRAIRIINKQKKTISWMGLQHSPQSLEVLNEQKKILRERIQQKQESVKELQKQVNPFTYFTSEYFLTDSLQQFTAYDNIVNRNKAGPLVAVNFFITRNLPPGSSRTKISAA